MKIANISSFLHQKLSSKTRKNYFLKPSLKFFLLVKWVQKLTHVFIQEHQLWLLRAFKFIFGVRVYFRYK